MASMEHSNIRSDTAREIKDRIGHINTGVDRLEAITNHLSSIRDAVIANVDGIYDNPVDKNWVNQKLAAARLKITNYADSLKP